MDKKLKLNSRMNVNIFMTDFWTTVANVSLRFGMFATNQGVKYVKKNIGIAEEMLKEDYPKTFKNQLEDLIKEVEL